MCPVTTTTPRRRGGNRTSPSWVPIALAVLALLGMAAMLALGYAFGDAGATIGDGLREVCRR